MLFGRGEATEAFQQVRFFIALRDRRRALRESVGPVSQAVLEPGDNFCIHAAVANLGRF